MCQYVWAKQIDVSISNGGMWQTRFGVWGVYVYHLLANGMDCTCMTSQLMSCSRVSLKALGFQPLPLV
jgi:hypothetical protein